MPRADGRIEPGQRLNTAISARAWNRAQQAADVVLGATPGYTAQPPAFASAPYEWVYARNDGASTANRWSVLKITGVTITPTATNSDAATKQFESMPVLSTDSTTPQKSSEWCVALEPIAANTIGRVAVSGVVQLPHAEKAKAIGADILWTDSANWSLVRFGGRDPVRLGKTTAAWNKGTLATIELYEQGTPPNETRNESPYTLEDCVNKFANVASGKWVMVARMANERWYLIAAECE